MLNLLKSILTKTTANHETSIPSRDRKGAVPGEWAISRAIDNQNNFYDVFSPDGLSTTFLFGEVSASGSRATTLMNLMQRAARSADQQTTAAQLNRMLYEQDRYAAMFWSHFDPDTRLLHFINAGHPPPLLFKANRRPMLRLDQAGPGLGVFPNATYHQRSVSLEPGDLLVIYSDGIVEASDNSDETFGEERLITVVELSRNKSVEEIRNRILSSVRVFARDTGPATNHTLLVIRYAPISAPAPMWRGHSVSAASRIVSTLV
jgi:sigma-B regulation protein RsbU (phosphoserine phosphatase)